jgi:glycosyltransferase involved in cell wall biosynthesis
MEVSALVPPSIPLIMGTEQLGDEARLSRGDVRVLEPPIDIEADHPGIDGRPFRLQHAVSDNEVLIVTVSRLSIELKLDALVDLIDATERLAARYPVRLIIVGDGPARAHLEARAASVNEAIGRTTVSLVGSMQDPRPAYAAADLVAGMGSSALRAMAIGKPLVVQGEGGFSLLFSPETYDTFLWQGFWGEGDGTSGSERLANQIEALISEPKRRSELAEYGRAVVAERFSLRRAAAVMEEVYADVISASGKRPGVREVVTMASRAGLLEVKQHQPSEKRKRTSVDQSRLESAARLRGQGRR